jgi:hypothetical protein
LSGLLLDQQFIQPDHASRYDGFRACIPHQLIGTSQLRREMFQQVRLVERRREDGSAPPVRGRRDRPATMNSSRAIDLRAREQRAAPVAELVARRRGRRERRPIRSG